MRVSVVDDKFRVWYTEGFIERSSEWISGKHPEMKGKN